MIRSVLLLASLLAPVTVFAAGPYPPAAGKTGTDAISKDDGRFVAWATGWSALTYGADVDATWRTPAKAMGQATSDPYDVVSLGNKGTITLYFPNPIMDGDGADFAVFENSFSDTFLELAWVEVSSDGLNYFRFPNVSLTTAKVGAFGSVDTTNLSGLAGKYRGGFGTPFDLGSLGDSPLLDKKRVRFVRIVDIAGDGSETDSLGNKIYDPYPTTGSAGFDLDAIGVIHQNETLRLLRMEPVSPGEWLLEWDCNPANRYRLETSLDLSTWTLVEEIPGSLTSGCLSRTVTGAGEASRFWRVVRIDG